MIRTGQMLMEKEPSITSGLRWNLHIGLALRPSRNRQQGICVLSREIISALVREQPILLENLLLLEEMNLRIQEMHSSYQIGSEDEQLRCIADCLLEAKRRYDRQEEILLPALEANGFRGPARVAQNRSRHLGKLIERLSRLAENPDRLDFEMFQKELNYTVAFLGPALRGHIYRENTILYPKAMQLIEEEEVWRQMNRV